MTSDNIQRSGWEKWHDWNAVVFAAMTRWFCDASGAAPKKVILDPNNRILLQVTLEDAAQADEMFSILMGEDVEQRRSFIQRNAKDVRFLDI